MFQAIATNYYNYYTDRKWGSAENYDVVLNSSKFGVDGCVTLLQHILLEEEK